MIKKFKLYMNVVDMENVYSAEGQFRTVLEISLSRKIEMTNTEKFELKR